MNDPHNYIGNCRLGKIHNCAVVCLSVLVLSFVLPEINGFVRFDIGKLASTVDSSSTGRSNTRAFDSEDGKNKNKKYVSVAEQERRDERKRRLERKNDVVIGRTSALENAKDFDLDVKATERLLLEKYDDAEKQARFFTDQGLAMLKNGDLEMARKAFNKVFELRPNVYLWQAGLVMYYMSDIYSAAECFVKNANSYEARFGEPASEERIWRDACELSLRSVKRRSTKEEGDKSTSPHDVDITPKIDPPDEDSPKERRKVVRIARELFSASVEGDHVNEILSLAKLRHITLRPGLDRMRWKFHSYFFLGLYYDSVGSKKKARHYMKKALIMSGGGEKSDDVLDTLPLLHMTHRDWFDDEDVEAIDNDLIDLNGSTNYITAIIKEETKSLSRNLLKTELKQHGFKCSNAKKAELQEIFADFIVTKAATDNDFM